MSPSKITKTSNNPRNFIPVWITWWKKFVQERINNFVMYRSRILYNFYLQENKGYRQRKIKLNTSDNIKYMVLLISPGIHTCTLRLYNFSAREILRCLSAWRFYQPLRGPDPMVKKWEEPIMKNQTCGPRTMF